MDENERNKIPRPAPAGSDARGQTLPYTPETNPASALNTSAPSAHAQARQMEADDPFIIRDSHGNVDEGATIGSLAAQVAREDGGEAPAAAPGPAGERRGYDTLPKPLSAEERRLGELERIVQDLKKNQWIPDPDQRIFIARITAVSYGTTNRGGATTPTGFEGQVPVCQWQEQCWIDCRHKPFDDGRKCTAFDGTAAVPAGSLAEAAGSISSNGALPLVSATPVYVGQLVLMTEVEPTGTVTTDPFQVTTNRNLPLIPVYGYTFVPLQQVVLVGPALDAFGGMHMRPIAGNNAYEGNLYGGATAAFNPAGASPYVLAEGMKKTVAFGVPNASVVVVNGAEMQPSSSPTAHLVNGLAPQIGMVVGVTNETPARLVVFVSQYPAPAFWVNVAVDGGANGTATSQATYTYTMTSLSAEILGTAMTPWKRRSKGKVIAGFQTALAFIEHVSGAVQLWDAGEVPDYTAYNLVDSIDFVGQTFTTQTVLSPT